MENFHHKTNNGNAPYRPSSDETITILTKKASKTSATSTMDKTFLTTGFGMRNAESLDKALREEERIRQMKELERRKRMLLEAQERAGREEEYSGSDRYSDVMSQTESLLSSSISSKASTTESKKQLDYLMGVTCGVFEEEASLEEWEFPIGKEEGEKAPLETTEAMRQAQRYLRTHKIFELFQFLIAHLLSVVPDNPVEFISDMLSKCLIFRAGYGNPPLLYNRRHVGELFNLMDPMRTGFINFNQYKTGMTTMGICSYDPNPPRNDAGLVSKDFFVEEAYERLTDLLNDMIRRRCTSTKAPVAPPPSPHLTIVWRGESEGSTQSSKKELEKD